MRIVFCGTPDSAVPSLEAIAALRPDWEIPLVLTQPDKGKGRGRELQPSPVREAATQLGLQVETPTKLGSPEMKALLTSLNPDVIAVVAYGKIFRPWLLELPRLGCLNLHFSLLPRHRGVAPVAWCLWEGDDVAGVTTMRMDVGIDTGPMFLRREVALSPQDTCGTLTAKLAAVGAGLLVETIRGVARGNLPEVLQPESGATYARALQKDDGRIDWTLEAEVIARHLRAVSPWPGAFTTFRGQPLKVIRSVPLAAVHGLRPGELLEIEGQVRCGTGAGELLLEEVQAAGKSKIEAPAWARGARLSPHEKFSSGA